MSCHTTEHGACAQALRCIIERPLTRNELASIEMLDAGFLARSNDKPALYSVTSTGREVMA